MRGEEASRMSSPEPQKVRLYGAIHHVERIQLFSSEHRDIEPNRALFTDLLDLGKGARIGVEWFNKQDWQEVVDDREQRAFKAETKEISHYDSASNHFWWMLMLGLRTLSLKAVPLEDKEVWKRYNQACVDEMKQGEEELFCDEGQSEVSYHARLCRHNERNTRCALLAKKIHWIERDNALLRAIKEKQVKAAIVGLGHSDFWVANREAIEKEHGIVFDRYATMKVRDVNDPTTTFEPDAVPDPHRVYDRICFERSLHMMEQGRITDATPDYVGIRDYCFPSKRYFEMFVRKRKGNKISGTIEDCLGSATFTGTENARGIEFVKTYDSQRCTSEADPKPVRYKAARQGNEFYGHWFHDGLVSSFYLVKKPKANPITMATRWCLREERRLI
jgi:hypothetical protein